MTDKQKDKQSIIDDFLSQIPKKDGIELDLPSKGKFYKNFKGATIRPLSWEDEKAIATNAKKGVDVFLHDCLQGIEASELIDIDSKYILIKLREISYGPDYVTIITCPKCGEESEASIDLREMPINHIPDTISNPREITLPVTGFKITLRFLTFGDEDSIKEPSDLVPNLWRIISQIEMTKDGKSLTSTDSKVISTVTRALGLEDINFIRSAANLSQYGVDAKFIFSCVECHANTLMEMPIGPDFFSVTSPSQ